MNVIVLAKSKDEGMTLANKLRAGGVDCASVVCGISQAVWAAQRMNACCVFFDRGFTEDYDSLFDQFENAFIWFVPFAREKDNMDIIAALNTHRAAYYLTGKIEQSEAERAIWNLQQRLKQSRQIYIDSPYCYRAKRPAADVRQ